MGAPLTRYFSLTGDTVVDGMTNGYFWYLDSTKIVDYSLSNGFQGQYWYYPTTTATYMGQALDNVSVYADIKFNYLGYYTTPSIAYSWGSEINLGLSQTGYLFSSNDVWAQGFFANSGYNTTYYTGAPGDIYLNASSPGASLPSYDPGSQGWFLLLHELLHTLGLKHPHDDGGTGRPTFTQLGLGSLDINWATVMSYNDGANWNLFTWKPATPMALDVLALQYLYGKNLTYNTTGTLYTLTETNFFYTLWDAGGIDTLDASTATKGWTIELPNVALSTLVDTKVGYAAPTSDLSAGTPHTLVWLTGDYENVNGSSYADIIDGNLFDNTIYGGAGNDFISGGAGNDTLYGGTGNDDFVYAANNNGIDTVADLQAGDIITVVGSNFNSALTSGNGLALGLNQIQYQVSNGNTYLYIGTDTTLGYDIKILLNGVFGSDQFVLSNSNITIAAHTNRLPTGSVTISGTATQGQTLTATNSLADADGLGAITYTWKANGTTIGTGASYTLTQAEVGKTLTATASYTDTLGATESVTSTATSTVSNVNHLPTGTVTITGTLTQGQTLTATNSLADADGLGAITYTWKANGTTIGTGASYTLTQAEVGKTLTATASYTDVLGSSESIVSTSTLVAGGPPPILNFGVFEGVNINLIFPIVLSSGATYYYLDANGDGGNSYSLFTAKKALHYVDTVSHTWLNDLLNGGLATVDTQPTGALAGIDDARTVIKNGYTLVLPSASDWSRNTGHTGLASQQITQIPKNDWNGANGYWLSTLDTLAVAYEGGKIGYHQYVNFPSGDAHDFSLPDSTADCFFVVFQVISRLPTGAVTITGTATQGQTLTATNNIADLDGLGVVTYTWKANGTTIGTGATYTLTQSEVGKAITATATYTDGYGAVESVASSASSSVANVNDLPTGVVSISGTAKQGQTLTATNTLADADGLGAISYTWKANGTAIGSGATYTLTHAELGKTITATASYIDLLGTPESVSSAATSSVAITLPQVSVSVSPSSVNESGASNLTYTFTRTGDLSAALTANLTVTGTASTSDYASGFNLLQGGTKVWTNFLGTSTDYRKSITAAVDGSIYISGTTGSSIDGQPFSGNLDAYITKYQIDGTKIWTNLIGTSGYENSFGLACGVDGSIYIAGSTTGSLDGQTNLGGSDAFIAKYQADGTKAWTKSLATSAFDEARAVIVSSDGFVYVSGSTQGSLDGQINSGVSDAFITKFQLDGTKVWTKLLGSGDQDAGRKLTIGSDGSIYVCGSTSGNLDGQINFGDYNVFITKYQSDGTKAWTKLFGSSSYDMAHAIITGLDGSLYVCGETSGAMDGQAYIGNSDAFLTKYSANGIKVWTKLLGSTASEVAYGLTLGLDGSIYVGGNTTGSWDGQTNIGSSDGFVTKYQTDGTKVWTKFLGSYLSNLTTGLDGTMYATGSSSGGDVLTKIAPDPLITFAAGSSTATLVIDPTADALVEGNETLTISIALGTGYDLGSTSTATGTIVDTIRFLGGSGNDTFVGNYLTDTRNNFVGAGGNDDITGNSRADVAEYSGNLSNYTIAASNGLITITDSRAGSSYDGTDTLHGINLLKFADGMEFVGLAAQRVALTGSEVNHTVQVSESKLYSGTNAAEKFVIGANVSSMILAGEGDTVHLTGSFTDYTYASRGSELQITKGDFMTTVNLAGNVSIETDLGHGLNAKLDFTQATPRVMLDTQLVTMGSIDATLLNTHAVL